ncbi:hypothetical protein [Marinactinospora rubrisoli]|uniref:Uncharacterized protein n=1 Tax=Marinactinospora rubrisoli TaxID=2715399 RepID=A0ABW2KQD7_9ACTN
MGRTNRPRPGETIADRKARLADERAHDSLTREDELVRRQAEIDHDIRLGRVEERTEDDRLRADIARQQRADARADLRSEADLAGWRRDLRRRGARLRAQTLITRSVEHRLVLKRRIQGGALGALGAALAAAVAWSTASVREGVLWVWGLAGQVSTAIEVVAWLAEPVMVGVAAGLIVLRTLLPMIGGSLTPTSGTDKLRRVEHALLGLSITLSAVPSLAAVAWTGGPAAVALGLVGTAVHAFPAIVAVLLAYTFAWTAERIAAADPTRGEGVRWLAEMDLGLDGAAPPVRPAVVDEGTEHAERIRGLLADDADVAEEARHGVDTLTEWLAEQGGVAVLDRPAEHAADGADEPNSDPDGIGSDQHDRPTGQEPSGGGADRGDGPVRQPHHSARVDAGMTTREKVWRAIQEHGPAVSTRWLAGHLQMPRSTVTEHRKALAAAGKPVYANPK